MPSKPKNEVHLLESAPAYFHICAVGGGLMVEVQPMLSTTGVQRLTAPSDLGIELVRLRDFLNTLCPTSSDTPEPPTCSSKA